jgi:nucleotide-binding universal stress UspA family protein
MRNQGANPGGAVVPTIVVGVDDSPRSEDAVALAGDLARAAGAEIVAVCAFPFDDREVEHFNLTMRTPMRVVAEAILERLTEPLNDVPHVRPIAVADPCPARALLSVADAADAALIVVGSSHAGHYGRLHPGSSAWRLLQGAPCPVALAPQGHRLRPHLRSGRTVAAFDGSPGSHAALETAVLIAHATGTSLRVIRVFARHWPAPAPPYPAGFSRITTDAERAAREQLARAVEEHPGAEAAFLIGDPARELARESEMSDLMVVGSRGYGPAPAVLLGDVSGELMHTAVCPVVIVPNGVETPLSGLFAQWVSIGSPD